MKIKELHNLDFYNYHFNYVEVVYRGKKEELSDVYTWIFFFYCKKEIGGNIMFTKIFIGLFCYVFLVVCNSKEKFLIEEAKKKERENKPVERPVYWCPRENRPVGREQERVTVPTKEINLEKDVESVYNLVTTSVHENLDKEEGNKLEHEVIEEVEYDKAVYDIPFPSDEDIPEGLLEYRNSFQN